MSCPHADAVSQTRVSHMNSEELVSLVIPLFNEEALVEILSERVTDAIDAEGCNFEVVLVDDGSNDSTYLKLREWQEKGGYRAVVAKLGSSERVQCRVRCCNR